MKILFLDIDGPMIPGRAYNMPGQTRPIVKTFDPCAVGLLNKWCEDRDWKIVLHSSWIRVWSPEETFKHCIEEGLKEEIFHEDAWCDPEINWRYVRVSDWVHRHKDDITHFMILDDEPCEQSDPVFIREKLVLVDFDDGITKNILNEMQGRNFKFNNE